MLLVYASPKSGKASSVDAKVLTPEGWKRMGDMRVGDRVCDPDGGEGWVEGVYPQGLRDAFKLTTKDGGSTVIDEEHLWLVHQKSQRAEGRDPVVLTTRQIVERGVKRCETECSWFLPVTEPVTFDSEDALPIDPYFLGLLLGDGCFRWQLRISTPDPEIVAAVTVAAESAGLRLTLTGKYEYRIAGDKAQSRGRAGGSNSFINRLKALGLWGHASHEKFIPAAYLRAPIPDRLALLRGLMDTDGDIGKGGRTSNKKGLADGSSAAMFNTSSPHLRDQVAELVYGLGGLARIGKEEHKTYTHNGEKRVGRSSWRIRVAMRVNPFTLPKKAERWHAHALPRSIESIEPAGQVECQCIKVSTKRNLYITDDYIVTHNTSLFLRAFPTAICIGIRSAIELVAMNTCGITPLWIIEDTTLPKLVDLLRWLKANPATLARFGAVYIDDFSQMCSRSVIQWGEENSKDKFYRFAMLDRYLDLVSILLRDLNVPCGLSAHKINYNPEKGIPSAPEVPSANQVQAVPGWADLVAPLGQDPNSLDPFWRATLQVDPFDQTFISGDRTNVCGPNTPANLREVLRASQASYALPRYPGLEWQEQWVQWVFERMISGVPALAAAEEVFANFGAYAAPDTPGERHVLWAVQDGIARYTIHQQRKGGFLGRAQALAAKMAAAQAPPPPLGSVPAPAATNVLTVPAPGPTPPPSPASGAPAPVPAR